MPSLCQLQSHQIAKVSGLADDSCNFMKKKLLALGFCNAHRVKVVRIAPLGCPIEVEILDTRVMLRQNEAKNILVEDIQ